MVCQNLSDLDQLEEAERRESEAVVPASSIFDGVEVDWSAVDLSSLGPVDLGALDETIEPVVSSSLNS